MGVSRGKGKFLTYLLRHDPAKAKLNMDSSGYVEIAQIVKNTNFTTEEIYELVETDDKKRFGLTSDHLKIRANQGHSIDIYIPFEKRDPPDRLYHGTPSKFLPSIKEKGILKMDRTHVHLSADDDTALKVGRRRGKPVVLVLDAKKMDVDGVEFLLSENGVWLVDYVHPMYIIEAKY